MLFRDPTPLGFNVTESLVIHAKPEAEQGNKVQFLVSPAGAITCSELCLHLTAYHVSGEQNVRGGMCRVKVSLGEQQVQHH